MLRNLPPAHRLLASPQAQVLGQYVPHEVLRGLVQQVISTLRDDLLAGRGSSERETLMQTALTLLDTHVTHWSKPRLRRVINATGVVLHTNLGRAPLGDEVATAIADAARGYVTLEYDLASGRRGHRDALLNEQLGTLFGAPAALVVNNCAAAMLLMATALCAGQGAAVSRSEIVEIGGGFRIPEILEACGARLIEVGTTNRTRIDDYHRAVRLSSASSDVASTPRSVPIAMFLKVHRSNFVLRGFTEDTSIEALRALADTLTPPPLVVYDLGSGLVDAAMGTALGLSEEPDAKSSLTAGADLVLLSGDKLLGSVQAGIIVGRADLIARLRRHPLARALRPGRIVIAGLEASVREHLAGRASRTLPTLLLLSQKKEQLIARAERLQKAIHAATEGRAHTSIVETVGRVGGGCAPDTALPGAALTLEFEGCSSHALERVLRTVADPPIIARVEKDRLLLDLRTIFEHEIESVAHGVAHAIENVITHPTSQEHTKRQTNTEHDDPTEDETEGRRTNPRIGP